MLYIQIYKLKPQAFQKEAIHYLKKKKKSQQINNKWNLNLFKAKISLNKKKKLKMMIRFVLNHNLMMKLKHHLKQ